MLVFIFCLFIAFFLIIKRKKTKKCYIKLTENEKQKEWKKYQDDYWKAINNKKFQSLYYIENKKAHFLFYEKNYKDSLVFFLRAMFFDVNANKLMLKDNYKKIDSFISLEGNCSRCIAYLNLDEESFKNIVINLPIEEGFNFDFSKEFLLPYFIKKYKLYLKEKKEFENKYKIRFLIGGKIK